MTDEPNVPGKPHTHKVWVQVDVDDGWYCTDNSKLVGGINLERARESLNDLVSFRPGYGTNAFNTNNQMYSPRKTLRQALEIQGLDPEVEYHKLFTKEDEYLHSLVIANKEEGWYITRRNRLKDRLTKQLEMSEPFDQLLLWSESTGISEETFRRCMAGDEDAPFLSEAYLYTLVGKDIARSVLGRVRALKSALGIES